MALATIALLIAQWVPPATERATYASPGGTYTLEVRPETRCGEGPARYVLRRHGAELWSRELPFRLEEVTVTDAGWSAGHLLTDDDEDSLWQWLEAVVLDPTGEERAHERGRLWSDTRVRGSTYHPVLDRWTLRVSIGPGPLLRTSVDEEWWVFDLSSGKLLSRGQPACVLESEVEELSAVRARTVLEHRAIPGTPLTLVCWGRARRGPGSFCGTYAPRAPVCSVTMQVDARGKVVHTEFREEPAEVRVLTFPSDFVPTDRPPPEIFLEELEYAVVDAADLEHVPRGNELRAQKTGVFDLFTQLDCNVAIHPDDEWLRARSRGSDWEVVRTRQRGADGRWLGQIVDAVTLPDGGFALLDLQGKWFRHLPARVVSYAPDGALREDRLLGDHLAFAASLDAGGDWVVVGTREPELLLSRRSTEELFKLDLSALSAGASWRFEVAEDGSELRLVELDHGTFLRLALP